MPFRLPLRRYVQTTGKSEVSPGRLGRLQWVLARPLYRFQTFDLAQVPAKSRSQALRLELAQWTPFMSSGYFVGWNGSQALVWCWNADQVHAVMAAQGLKPKRVQILPESLLQAPVDNGLCLTRCLEGFEGQLWRNGILGRSRWWPQAPTANDWLSFQRDAAVPPNEQQYQPPVAREAQTGARSWLRQSAAAENLAVLVERPLIALGLLCLIGPVCWFGFSLYKIQQQTDQLVERQARLQTSAAPVMKARSEALDSLARIKALQVLARYPGQLVLMARIAEALPNTGLTLKDWDFSGHQLKVTLTGPTDVPVTPIIDRFQRAGPFGNVQAVPGRDPRSVTFQMDVLPR